MERMLDTYRPVETPEGVEIGLRVAGPVPRLFAALIDAGLRTLLYVLLAIPTGALGKSGTGIFLVGLFCGEWFYPVLFEVLSGGATPARSGSGSSSWSATERRWAGRRR